MENLNKAIGPKGLKHYLEKKTSNKLCKSCLPNDTQQDGRLPPEYFVLSHFCRKAFKKLKIFFFSKKHSSILFSYFFQLKKFSDFLPKKHIIRAEKTRNNTNGDIKKNQNFRKTHLLCFRKKPQILNVLRNLNISVAFCSKFATIR